MVDRLMAEEQTAERAIDRRFIGMQFRVDLDVLEDRPMDAGDVRGLDWQGNRPPAALAHPKDSRLADRAAAGAQLLALVLVLLDAADIGLIDLHDTAQLFKIRAARLTQPVQHEPCRLLRDADLLGQLQAADPLAGRDQQIHGVNPLVQRDVRPLEDGAGSDGKILLALVAAIEALLANRDPLTQSADWTGRTVRPEAAFQIDAGSLLIGEHGEKLESGNGDLGHSSVLCGGLFKDNHILSVSDNLHRLCGRVAQLFQCEPCSLVCAPFHSVDMSGCAGHHLCHVGLLDFDHRWHDLFLTFWPDNSRKRRGSQVYNSLIYGCGRATSGRYSKTNQRIYDRSRC